MSKHGHEGAGRSGCLEIIPSPSLKFHASETETSCISGRMALCNYESIYDSWLHFKIGGDGRNRTPNFLTTKLVGTLTARRQRWKTADTISWTEWVGKAVQLYTRIHEVLWSILGWSNGYFNWYLHGFPRSLRQNVRIEPPLGYDASFQFLSN
jgi:hypothetical protein